MSTILDALRKAEQERELGKVPDLRHVHTPGVMRSGPSWWLVGTTLVALNIMLLGALLAYRWWPTPSTFTPAVTPSATPQLEPPPASSLSAAPEPTAVAPIPPATIPVPRPVESFTPTPVAVSPPAVAPAPRPVDPSPADLQSLAPDVLANLGETSPPTPLSAMPGTFQNSLPAINLDVHVYSDEVARRFVLINGQRYREGDWLQEGPLLESIIPEGIIMNHQQTRFSIAIER